METPFRSLRTATSLGATQPDRAATSEAPAFETAQLAVELQSAARHMRVPETVGTSADLFPGVAIAVLIPCHDEAATIGAVIGGFRAALPQARIAVLDNGSKDETAAAGRAAGAEVFVERRRGKGNVVRRMFAEISADVYVMADGDATYDASAAPQLVAMIVNDRVDMAVGVRANVHEDAHRPGHALGNRLFNRLYGALFGYAFGDIFSGYRAFSRRFVKSFPALSSGFEIETELSVHALELDLAVGEVFTPYYARPEGSASKLSTWSDGLRILGTIVGLYRSERPLPFFSGIGTVLAIVSVVLAIPIFITYFEEGVVPRFPTAILSTGLMLLAFLSVVAGLVLDTV